jgi:hypothetical protein
MTNDNTNKLKNSKAETLSLTPKTLQKPVYPSPTGLITQIFRRGNC